jgi:hypothetical protein
MSRAALRPFPHLLWARWKREGEPEEVVTEGEPEVSISPTSDTLPPPEPEAEPEPLPPPAETERAQAISHGRMEESLQQLEEASAAQQLQINELIARTDNLGAQVGELVRQEFERVLEETLEEQGDKGETAENVTKLSALQRMFYG